jgi:hypothetical protein
VHHRPACVALLGCGKPRTGSLLALVLASVMTVFPACAIAQPAQPAQPSRTPAAGVSPYPWHTGIAATTFWVGEVLNSSSDGSQVYSTYDAQWEDHYGGCDGIEVDGACRGDPRTAANGYFPTQMTPKENPFYLDLPFDDVHNATAHAQRRTVVPWAHQVGRESISLMKNRWVELQKDGRTCYGQIEDAGPEQYADAHYVFGTHDERPANRKINGAGLDVSPALNGCLGFGSLDSDQDRVSWRFVDGVTVEPGPWTRIVTTSPVTK